MRTVLACAIVLLGCFCLAQSVQYFDVSNICIVETISHDRIYMTIDPAGAWFPYSGQVGWRIYFSRWYIGWDDPQYEYTVWILPARGFDLSPSFWFVRPKGLEGEWHYRVDAIDSSRVPIATSNEKTYNFSTGTAIPKYTATIAWVANDNLWKTSFTFTNANTTSATVSLFFYEANGDPFSVIHGGNVYTTTIPAKSSTALYVGSIIGNQYIFYGHIEMESDKPLDYLTFISDGEKYLCTNGTLK